MQLPIPVLPTLLVAAAIHYQTVHASPHPIAGGNTVNNGSVVNVNMTTYTPNVPHIDTVNVYDGRNCCPRGQHKAEFKRDYQCVWKQYEANTLYIVSSSRLTLEMNTFIARPY